MFNTVFINSGGGIKNICRKLFMTIYATPFRASDKQCTGPSADSGFTDIVAVVAIMGPPISQPTERYAIYGDDENRAIFSRDVIFCIDETNNIN